MRSSTTLMSTVLFLTATVFGQGTGEYGTYYCMTVEGKPAPSNNFCNAVKGAVLPSPGFCCIRSSDFDRLQALSKGCADNGLVLGQKKVPCSP
ncbi:hypothetical protein JMJ77_0014888 [Colletotrichum scovillei]|uniref:Uncharacterized protein n=1 Tax=Colletotrichum scovillei TaxID=1209932 RepID=A0A9P7R1A5_9PEZI|nr:hypothetical protein JMJ77_0014888 [Colletotrichum scovillei]KAG7056500.1 hypothetical protein JMJ78_0000299 [Colletotrichum scovillei]KAG7066430.1 hypothetical protein JMJ76_0000291 [Colletotrichum scovillei]